MSNLFAPPTKEELELDLFAPPRRDELAAPMDELDSAGRGLAQGVLFGLRDEGAGALKAPLGALKQFANQFGANYEDADTQIYREERDLSRELDEQAKKQNPGSYLAGELGGGVASAFVPGLNLAKGASAAKVAAAAAAQGGLMGFGNSEAEGMDLAQDVALGAGMGGLGGYGVAKGVEKLSPLISKGANKVGQALKSKAENLAVNATGATGVQSAKFADNAGRQLLDRGLVRAFDSAEDVAGRVAGASEVASQNIDDALRGLDAKGVTASVDDIVANLEAKLKSLEGDPSQAGTARKLRTIIDDIYQSGSSQVPLSAAEQTKRGFNKAAGNWMDPEAGRAGKQAYLSYMDEVERAAGADPALAAKFKEGKETFGLLAPIQEAAEKRAMQQRQAPWGGLGDLAALGSGGAAGGPIGALAGVVAKKTVLPKVTSTMAVGADKLSKALLQSPNMANFYKMNPTGFSSLVNQLQKSLPPSKPKIADETKLPDKEALLQKAQGSKYAQVLQNAAGKSDQSFAAAHFVLAGRDPEYRKVMEGNGDLDQSGALGL